MLYALWCSIICALCCLLYALCSMLYALCSVLCALCSMHYMALLTIFRSGFLDDFLWICWQFFCDGFLDDLVDTFLRLFVLLYMQYKVRPRSTKVCCTFWGGAQWLAFTKNTQQLMQELWNFSPEISFLAFHSLP